MTNLSFSQSLKKKFLTLNQLIKTTFLFIFPLIVNRNWKTYFIPLKTSIFKYSRKKQCRKKNQATFGFFLLTMSYLTRACYIARALLPVVVLKPLLRRFISGKKSFLCRSAGNMSKFVMLQRWKDWE